MKENKEIKKEELENVSEAQETEQQEQKQEEAPKEEQKQEEKKDEKPEKAKESIWQKAGRYVKAGAKKVCAGIKKAAPVVAIGTIVGGAMYFKGQADAYNSMLGDGNGEDIPELPGNTEEPADSVIEDAEFKEITADESQSE